MDNDRDHAISVASKKARMSDNFQAEHNTAPISLKNRNTIAAKLKSTTVQCIASSTSKSISMSTKSHSTWCPHCNCHLSNKTFKRHKSLYFDSSTNT